MEVSDDEADEGRGDDAAEQVHADGVVIMLVAVVFGGLIDVVMLSLLRVMPVLQGGLLSTVIFTAACCAGPVGVESEDHACLLARSPQACA